jgi:type II secretory pathway pseudopilin PulG
MRFGAQIRRTPRPAEEGYILVAVMFMLAILIISLAIAVPRVKEEIQRDREIETMHRGKQYTRAIQLYYRKFHAYPPNVDALVKTNEIRFLRKRYADPMTGKDDWKPIMFGQNKAPLAMGFFGQPLAGGSVLAGTGPSGGNGVAGASPIGGTPGSTSGGSSFSSGSSFSGGSSFSSGSSLSGGSSMFGSSGSSSTGGLGTTTGTGTSSTPGALGGSTDSSGSNSSGSGPSLSSNQTYGGGGIIGFSPGSEKQSILTYKKKNHYNEWEFTYSPLSDQKMIGGGNQGTIGQPAGGTSGTGVFGNNPSSGLGGTSPTSPTSPTPPTSPTQPQQ